MQYLPTGPDLANERSNSIKLIVEGLDQELSFNISVRGKPFNFCVINGICHTLDNGGADTPSTLKAPPHSTQQLHVTGPDYQSYLSCLPVDAHPHLERQLDWGHGGVDRDLNEIADHSLDWEEKLSVPLGLTATDISDIKTMHQNKPQLQR